MPRPTNKTTLIALSNENYQKLWALIDDFDEDEKINGKTPFVKHLSKRLTRY